MGPGTKKKLRVGAFFRVGQVTPIQQFFFLPYYNACILASVNTNLEI